VSRPGQNPKSLFPEGLGRGLPIEVYFFSLWIKIIKSLPLNGLLWKYKSKEFCNISKTSN
jgi:hypothetical protein